MKMNARCYGALLVGLVLPAFGWAADLRAEMEAVNREWLTAYNSKAGAAAFSALYTQNAMVLPPGTAPIAGSEAIGRFWADVVKDGKITNHTFEIVSIERDGRYAYQVARWTADFINDQGETAKRAGNTVRVFEKQPDGKGLVKVHIFNRT